MQTNRVVTIKIKETAVILDIPEKMLLKSVIKLMSKIFLFDSPIIILVGMILIIIKLNEFDSVLNNHL